MTVILDNAYGNNKAKNSPDNTLECYAFTRKLVKAIAEELATRKIKFHILVPETYDVSPAERVRRANFIYDKDKGAFLISVQVNTSGVLGGWNSSRGWSVFVANESHSNSRRLANDLYDSAYDRSLNCIKQQPDQKYWCQNLYLTKNCECPAAVTKNFFADNKKDLEYLLSDRGFKALVDLHVEAIETYLKGK